MDALRFARRSGMLALACFAATAFSPETAFAAAMRYTVTDAPPGFGNGLDNNGQITERSVRPANLGQIQQSDMRHLYQLYNNPAIINVMDGSDDGRLLINTYGTGNFTRYYIYDPTYNYDGGGFIEFGTGDSLKYLAAHDMNARGDVVGNAGAETSDPFPFLYDGVTGELLDLRGLMPPDSGLREFSAYAINDSGQILGGAYSIAEGRRKAYILTPHAVPEPTTLALAVVVGAAVGIRRLRQPRNR